MPVADPLPVLLTSTYRVRSKMEAVDLYKYTHTLVADAIRWTDGPLNRKQKDTLIMVFVIMTTPNLSPEDFLAIQKYLGDAGFNTAPPPEPNDEEDTTFQSIS